MSVSFWKWLETGTGRLLAVLGVLGVVGSAIWNLASTSTAVTRHEREIEQLQEDLREIQQKGAAQSQALPSSVASSCDTFARGYSNAVTNRDSSGATEFAVKLREFNCSTYTNMMAPRE